MSSLKPVYIVPISTSFNNPACRKGKRNEIGDKQHGTALSQKMLEIKDKRKTHRIEWKIVGKAYLGNVLRTMVRAMLAKEEAHCNGYQRVKQTPPGCATLSKKSEIKCSDMMKYSLAFK